MVNDTVRLGTGKGIVVSLSAAVIQKLRREKLIAK